MMEAILQNLKYIGYASALLATTWLANFLLEVYYSRMVAHSCKTARDCLTGVLRFLAVCAGVTLLTVAISAFPPFLAAVGLSVPDEYVEATSVLVIIGLFAKSIYEYTVSAMQKLNSILKSELAGMNAPADAAAGEDEDGEREDGGEI